MPTISPCLWFDNQAEEAANFYVSIFKNSKLGDIARYGKSGPGEEGSVLTVEFTLDGQEYLALNGGPQFPFTEAVSFQILCDTQAEIDDYWAKLTAGGGQDVQCGWLKDKFGLSWQVSPKMLHELIKSPDKAKAARVTEAMLQMVKLDIAKLEAAATG